MPRFDNQAEKTETPSSGSSWNINQMIMSVLAVLVVGGTILMYVQGQTPPDALLGFAGLILGVYFRRDSDDNALRLVQAAPAQSGSASK